MRVLALDPGERVGWARAEVGSDCTWTDLRHGITPLKDMALAVHYAQSNRGETPYDLIVCEGWRLQAGKQDEFIGSEFRSSQFIGMVRLCGWTSGTDVVLQEPRVKYHQCNEPTNQPEWLREKLDKFPKTHDDAHDADALLHLWYWTWLKYA